MNLRKKLLIEVLSNRVRKRLLEYTRTQGRYEKIVSSNLLIESIVNTLNEAGKRTRIKQVPVGEDPSKEALIFDPQTGRYIPVSKSIKFTTALQKSKDINKPVSQTYSSDKTAKGGTEVVIVGKKPIRPREISTLTGEEIPEENWSRIRKVSILTTLYDEVYDLLMDPNVSDDAFNMIIDQGMKGNLIPKDDRYQVNRDKYTGESGKQTLLGLISGCIGKNPNTYTLKRVENPEDLFDPARKTKIGETTTCKYPGLLTMFRSEKFSQLMDKKSYADGKYNTDGMLLTVKKVVSKLDIPWYLQEKEREKKKQPLGRKKK